MPQKRLDKKHEAQRNINNTSAPFNKLEERKHKIYEYLCAIHDLIIQEYKLTG